MRQLCRCQELNVNPTQPPGPVRCPQAQHFKVRRQNRRGQFVEAKNRIATLYFRFPHANSLEMKAFINTS